ncbi:hypothetical protein HD554DRAFT_2013110 [Boletus coccyginus]|nr:hypothetical protein HD554DRAFT_2013110 [Boletus coccyginus]
MRGQRECFSLSSPDPEVEIEGIVGLGDKVGDGPSIIRESKWAANPRFLFTSSVAWAQGWNKNGKEVQFDAGVAVGPGYGASKHVSERVGYRQLNRIGQITGSAPRGAWSTSTARVPIIIDK